MNNVRNTFLSMLLFLIGSAHAFTITSFNIRNFKVEGPYTTNPESLKSVLDRNLSDLNAFQEIVDTTTFKKLINSNYPKHRVLFSKCGGYGQQKLAFVYNSTKFNILEIIEELDITGNDSCNSGVRPLLRIKVVNKSTSEKFWALLVHLKAGSNYRDISFRKDQLSFISSITNALDNFVIIGDFNTTQFFKTNGKYFHDFLSTNDFTYSSSQVNCSSYWWGAISDNYFYPSLLDHILISPKLSSNYNMINFTNGEHCNLNRCAISSQSELGDSFNNVSDHCPIKATLTRK